MFRKILIANRGEIAVRIIRACREMGIATVAVYSEADKDALHTQLADEAICIGPAAAGKSYLNMEQILSACIATKADAIHPGFGFLSENSRFAQMCERCKIAWIGPKAEMMDLMGNKAKAKLTMIQAGIPVIPGTKEPITEAAGGKILAEQIGYPVMIKAALGGGGKGMRISWNAKDFEENFQMAQLEAERGFGDRTMYLEKYVQDPRHIEVQIVADGYGNVVQLGERDCTIQRNHQKMIEESPSTALDAELRKKMGEAAVAAAKAVQYENVGTVEFLLDREKNFYFMEMNTRIQVEHPVTEMVTGIDLIKEMIRVAAGEKLSMTQEQIQMQGWAMECRINAEDPEKEFRPCPGTIQEMHLPGGNGIRVDTAVYNGYAISPFYDSMIAKVIVHGRTRQEALEKMRSALGELIIDGVTTNIDFQYEILNHPDFQAGKITTDFIATNFSKRW